MSNWAYVGSWNQNRPILRFALQKFCNSLLAHLFPASFDGFRGVVDAVRLCSFKFPAQSYFLLLLAEDCLTAAPRSMIKKICRNLPWTTDLVAPFINPPSIHPTTGLIQPWCHLLHLPLLWNGVVGKSRVEVATQNGRLIMANDRRHLSIFSWVDKSLLSFVFILFIENVAIFSWLWTINALYCLAI